MLFHPISNVVLYIKILDDIKPVNIIKDDIVLAGNKLINIVLGNTLLRDIVLSSIIVLNVQLGNIILLNFTLDFILLSDIKLGSVLIDIALINIFYLLLDFLILYQVIF